MVWWDNYFDIGKVYDRIECGFVEVISGVMDFLEECKKLIL